MGPLGTPVILCISQVSPCEAWDLQELWRVLMNRQNPVTHFISFVTLGKYPKLSVAQFLHVYNGRNDHNSITGLL